MSNRLSNFAKWKLQVSRKINKWVSIIPEYDDYMPTPKDFRYPRPSSQPQPYVPRQQFMKDFDIKYYRSDFRETKDEYKVLNRDEYLANPIRLMPGETVGPFHGNTQTTLLYHEDEDTQVYTYEKSKTLFEFNDESEILGKIEEAKAEQK
eukprot:gene8009-12474_t